MRHVMTTCMLLSFSTFNSHTFPSMTTNTPNSHTSRSMMNNTPSSDLTTALTSLYQSIDECETWQPSLHLESSHFTMDGGPIRIRAYDKLSTNIDTVKEPIDIVKLLSSFEYLHEHNNDLRKLGYPPGAAFQLEGYSGTESLKEVKEIIETAGIKEGSHLSTYSSVRSPNKQ